MMRQQRIENELADIRELPFAQVIQCMPFGIERNDLWVLWIPGQSQTVFQHGIYPVSITFPLLYPRVAPTIAFPDEFKHIHVYQNGAVCMPLLEPQYWKPKTSMPDIIQRLISLVHQQVNLYSPANMQLFNLYRTDRQEYVKIMREQSKKFGGQERKYYQEACVHVRILAK